MVVSRMDQCLGLQSWLFRDHDCVTMMMPSVVVVVHSQPVWLVALNDDNGLMGMIPW